MPSLGGALDVHAVGFFVAAATPEGMDDAMEPRAQMVNETREEELQRVAAIAAAEVVRIMSTVPQQMPTAAAIAAESMRKDVESIKEDVGEIKAKLENHYVSVEQFEPVKRIVYFVLGVFGVAVVGAIVKLVVRP